MTDIAISKITNLVTFKVDNKSYKDAQNKIKKIAALWNKSSNQFSKAMEQGRRASTLQTKATTKQTRAEIRAYRTRKNTLKADNIRFKEQIKNSLQFKQQLQKLNAEFLKGNISSKERAASIGQLVKQYRSLNQQASRYNQTSKSLGAIKSIRQGAATATRIGVAGGAIGVGAAVGGGMITRNQFDKIKSTGQEFEALVISLQNTFGNRSTEISTKIRNMSDDNGVNLLELGNNLVEFVSLMRPLGIQVDDAITKFQQTSDAMASYGIGGDRAAGFMQQMTQALDQGTLDSFKEAFNWAPQLRADLLQYVQDEMKISAKDFMGGLTNGKYSLRDSWFKFLNANSTKYSQMASKFKQSSTAQDARVGNELSIAIYRIFETSGFKQAMQAGAKIISDWANLLDANANKIGEIFGNLYSIVGELSKEGFENLSKWLQELTADDIKTYFKDMKTGISEFMQAMRSLASFINDILPDRFVSNKQSTTVKDEDRKNYDAEAYGKAYVSKERELLNSGLEPSVAARQAEQFALQQSKINNVNAPEQKQPTFNFPKIEIPKFNIPQPTFKAPTFENSVTLNNQFRQQPKQQPSNFSGKLNLKIESEINKQGFSDFVDFKINDNNLQTINLMSD